MTEAEVILAAEAAGYGIERSGDGGLFVTRAIGSIARSIRVTTTIDNAGVSFDDAIAYLDAHGSTFQVSAIPSSQIYIPPSGADDTDAFVSAALRIASGGGHRIVLRDRGAYTVNEGLTFDITAGVAIEGNGATIDFSGASTTATLFDLAGTETTIGTLTADCAAGSTTLPMTTTSGLAAGDQIMLVSGAVNSWATGVAVGEMARVLTVEDGTHVTLQAPLAYAYASVEVITVSKVSGATLTIRDLNAVGRASSASSQTAINCRNVPVQIDGVELRGFDSTGVRLRRVPGATVRNLRVRNGRAVGLAYGLAIDRGTRDVTVSACHFDELRHGVTAGGSAGVVRNVIVSGCHATACREAGLDMHPGCDEFKFVNNIIELGADAESDGDGIIGQGPRFTAAGNTITGFKRHGVFHQVAGGQSHIVPVGVISDNTLSAAAGTGTRAAVIVQPGGTMCAPGKYYIDRNRGSGSNLAYAVYVDTQGDDIAWLDVIRNDIPGTSSRGVYVIADTGTVISGGDVSHNHVGGGTNEAILLHGIDDDGVSDLLCAWNRSTGGSYALRIVNGLRIEYGQLLGSHTTVLTSGLNNCRALGGPNTPAP